VQWIWQIYAMIRGPDFRVVLVALEAYCKKCINGKTMPQVPIYKVIFHNNNKIYELYARAIYQSDMYGFIEIEEIVFGDESQILVNPGEEKLKNEFSGVTRSYIPMHSIVRIDEVEKEGPGKIVDSEGGSSNVRHFPSLPGRPINRSPDTE
jgi:hypothetical protein